MIHNAALTSCCSLRGRLNRHTSPVAIERPRQTALCKKQSRDAPCGTCASASGQVLVSDNYDGKVADIWSAGVMLYVLLAGTFRAFPAPLVSVVVCRNSIVADPVQRSYRCDRSACNTPGVCGPNYRSFAARPCFAACVARLPHQTVLSKMCAWALGVLTCCVLSPRSVRTAGGQQPQRRAAAAGHLPAHHQSRLPGAAERAHLLERQQRTNPDSEPCFPT